MPRKTVNKNQGINAKLEYLGLDLNDIPKKLMKFEPLDYRISKAYDEKQYRVYKYISVNDIEILLSPTNRLDNIEEKYKKASPIYEYLDSENEENIVKYTTFLNMLKQLNEQEIEKIEEEQNNLNKLIPFKVKYEGNYLWQIYYSENTDRYFMIVSTEDSDYSTFFFLLKKQIESKRNEKIFVPIRNIGYSRTYLKKSEFEDIENYLWLFTKDWPLIYEVYDKNEELSIQIVGETGVYEKIKSPYKIKLKSKEEASQFYKLLKAMFILQTELPHYFNFRTDISKKGEIDFFIENRKIEYNKMPQMINEEYMVGNARKEAAEELIEKNKKRLENLKLEISELEIEYLAKEKQISTFLECKKTFFGRFKYYFKYSKKAGKNSNIKKIAKKDNLQIKEEIPKIQEKKKETKSENKPRKERYTIEELLNLYKDFEKKEDELKNIFMDINALKLKKKNMLKKIENATAYINEIDSHKKSIFEFWRYSNKDEVETLPEGEEEEVNIIKRITKVFDYEEDLEKFGKTMDGIQRKLLTKDEKDSIYITSTNLLEILNKVKNNEVIPKEIENSLKEIKKEAIKEKALMDDEFDIFGGIVKDTTKITNLNQKTLRELPKDKFNILDINKNTKTLGYKLALEKVIQNTKKALTKIVISESLPVYIAVADDKLKGRNINVFNINPENEVNEILKKDAGRINLYKVDLKEGTNAISYTNCIFYDNQNRTLPEGQDISTKILVDISKLKLTLNQKLVFHVVEFENEGDFAPISIKSIFVYEYDSTVGNKNLK